MFLEQDIFVLLFFLTNSAPTWLLSGNRGRNLLFPCRPPSNDHLSLINAPPLLTTKPGSCTIHSPNWETMDCLLLMKSVLQNILFLLKKIRNKKLYWIKKYSNLQPSSKIKEDHSVVAKWKLYWRGWVNTLLGCFPWILRLRSLGSMLILFMFRTKESCSPGRNKL